MRRILSFILSTISLLCFILFLVFGYCVLENKAFTQTPQKLTIEVRTINKINKYNIVVGTVKDLGDLVEVVETTPATEESTDENNTEQTTEKPQKKKMGEDEVIVTQSPDNVGKTSIYIGTDEDLKYFCFPEDIEVGKEYTVVTTTQHNINCSPSMQKTMIILTVIAIAVPILWFLFGSNIREKKVQLF